MNNLKVSHFKCFDSQVELNLPDNSNLLLCGENGAGKSSLFEAIKFVFYRDKILPNVIGIAGPAAPIGGQQALKRKYFNRRNPQTPFEILVDREDYEIYNVAKTDAFFISCEDLKKHDKISLDEIFSTLYFPSVVLERKNEFWSDVFLQYVNDSLHDDFFEEVHLEIQQGDGHCFKVVDEKNGIDECDHLDETYNEAKLDIIFLAIFFQLIDFSQIPAEHHKLLVMDDVINSLDMANRGLVAKFIMTHFQDCQILLLTHNVSFYNLFSYAISNYNNRVNTWQKRLLYEIGDTRVLVKDESPETVASIKADFKPENDNCEPIGNRIRKLFEYLLHEYARLMQMGDYMEISTILEKIINTDAGKIYLQINGDCVYSESDLLRTIKGIADVTQPEHIREYINKQFLNYDSSEFFKPLVPVLQDMKLFQKLTLHQLSHDQLQTPTFSTKEIECCFYLLEKLEKVVLGLRKMNSGGNIYRV
mgnify:FL=1